MPGAPKRYLWQNQTAVRTGPITLIGYGMILLFIGAFGGWAVTAPIASATIAPGVIAAAGQNVKIQHLEGGIIRKVVAHEGTHVKKGDPLLILDDTAAQADLYRLLKQVIASEAEIARLSAERDSTGVMTVPADFDEYPAVLDPMRDFTEQQRQFKASKARYTAEENVLKKRVNALSESLTGMKTQKDAIDKQVTILREEADLKKQLVDKGLASRDQYATLESNVANLVGQAGQLEAQIAGTVSQIGEASEQIEQLTTTRVENAIASLNKARVQLGGLREQVRTATAVLKRTTIRAPADGIIVHSVYNSPGSVIRPGEVLMELLPTDSDLIVEAHVRPQDIDLIKPNQVAEMSFTALNTRTTPKVRGKVFYISADHLVTPNTGKAYYVVRLKLDQKLPPEIKTSQVYPGMPVEAFISTGERTFAQYLIKPLLDSMSMAFRQS